jgi:quinol monooxygenase YgiN
MPPPGRIDLHLRIRVKPGQREAFLAFLREAKPFYESPGGIEVRLLEDVGDDHRFIELILYDDEATYAKDLNRVRDDPEMKSYLQGWRTFLAEQPVVETYRLTEI